MMRLISALYFLYGAILLCNNLPRPPRKITFVKVVRNGDSRIVFTFEEMDPLRGQSYPQQIVGTSEGLRMWAFHQADTSPDLFDGPLHHSLRADAALIGTLPALLLSPFFRKERQHYAQAEEALGLVANEVQLYEDLERHLLPADQKILLELLHSRGSLARRKAIDAGEEPYLFP